MLSLPLEEWRVKSPHSGLHVSPLLLLPGVAAGTNPPGDGKAPSTGIGSRASIPCSSPVTDHHLSERVGLLVVAVGGLGLLERKHPVDDWLEPV